MEIKNCTVETTKRYSGSGTYEEPKDMLILSLPLPGGKAIYEIEVTAAFASNIEKASQLVK